MEGKDDKNKANKKNKKNKNKKEKFVEKKNNKDLQLISYYTIFSIPRREKNEGEDWNDIIKKEIAGTTYWNQLDN